MQRIESRDGLPAGAERDQGADPSMSDDYRASTWSGSRCRWQLYSRAYNDKDPRGRHNNTFYLFEALIKLAAAPAVAAYLHEADHGGPRVAALDRLLAHLALPSLGQWVAMLRELARHFGSRPDAAAHPLGHLWDQLDRPHRDRPGCWPCSAGSRTASTVSRPATRAARSCRCRRPGPLSQRRLRPRCRPGLGTGGGKRVAGPPSGSWSSRCGSSGDGPTSNG